MTANTVGSGLLFDYAACGLRVISSIELPGLIAHAAADTPGGSPDQAADIHISQGDVPEALRGELVNQGPNWDHSGSQFLLRVTGVGRFLIEDARTITFTPEDEQAPSDLTAFLTGSVMGLLLHLRGNVVLHGSAMLVGGKAVVFCGPSGAGKSTMAAALGQRGYTMLSDDLCVVTMRDGAAPLIYPDGRKHKLWEKAIEKLDLADRQGGGVRHQLHKFYVEPATVQTQGAPLAALYELREARALDALEVTDPSLADAALIVRRNAFRPRIMWQLGQKGAYFGATAQIARSGGVHLLNRPLDFARMDDVLDTLTAHWRKIGLEPG